MLPRRITRSQTKLQADSRSSSCSGVDPVTKVERQKKEQAMTMKQFVENKVKEHKAREQILCMERDILETESSASSSRSEGKSRTSSKGAGRTLTKQPNKIGEQLEETTNMRLTPKTTCPDSPPIEIDVFSNEPVVYRSNNQRGKFNLALNDRRPRSSRGHDQLTTSAAKKRARPSNISTERGKVKLSKKPPKKEASYYDGQLNNVCPSRNRARENEDSDSY